MRKRSKVLLIGWDAADWKVIHPLLDSGKMPNLARLVERGVSGNLATIEPILSPMLWTSIATGKRAHKHGILGFTEVEPTTGGVRPVTTLGRKTKAIWNILSQEGLRSNVVGWWPSHPAEPIRGAMVSNHFHAAHRELEKPWPVPEHSVHPARLREALERLRIHPQELTHEHLGPFVPRWREIPEDARQPLGTLAKIIAECTTVHSAATALMQLEPWDFMAVYFDSIDHFSHAFMRYHPPRNPWVPETEFEWFQGVIESAYRYHDLMLGTLLSLAGGETTVLLISDHGFHPGEQRLPSPPLEPAGPAAEHRTFGIFVAAGPGLRKDERVYGASLLDIVPTLLALFGLPAGEDMDGKPLLTLFENPPAIQTIPSWDAVAGEDGAHPAGARFDSLAGPEALNQLVALGYIAAPNPDLAKAREQTTAELKYNLARSLMSAREFGRAGELLAALHTAHPGQHRFGIQLAVCQRALGKPEELKRLVHSILARRREEAREAGAELAEWRARCPEIAEPAKLGAEEQRRYRALTARAAPSWFAFEFLLGYAERALGHAEAALAHLEKARELAPRQAGLHNQLAEVYLRLRRWAEAEQCFNFELEIDAENAAAQAGLARCYLRKREFYRAARAALASVGLVYFNPYAHFLLGVAMQRFGSAREAAGAYQVALAQQPFFPAAHRGLSQLYARFLEDPVKAEEHRRLALEMTARRRKNAAGQPRAKAAAPTVPAGREGPSITASAQFVPPSPDDWITIVSGLPRSGTSLMMQMLAAGGLCPLTDGQRPADEDNPLGYLEFEPAKNLQRDAAWLGSARGKCVKIVAQLLPFLPSGEPYRVILMERPLAEVLASQAKMLERKNPAGAKAETRRLAETFAAQWEQTRVQLAGRGIPHLVVSYHDCLRAPEETVRALGRFLGGAPLDLEAMRGSIRPELHRNRTPADGGGDS